MSRLGGGSSQAGPSRRGQRETNRQPGGISRGLGSGPNRRDGVGSSLASVSGFYGTAVAPPGSALIAWQGVGDGGPQRQPDQDEEQPPKNQPPGEDDPPEPEDQPITDPSDPTQQQ